MASYKSGGSILQQTGWGKSDLREAYKKRVAIVYSRTNTGMDYRPTVMVDMVKDLWKALRRRI